MQTLLGYTPLAESFLLFSFGKIFKDGCKKGMIYSMKKLVIVGGVTGGMTTASQIRKLHSDIEIIVYEKGEYVSFANCGLPYYLGNVIENRDDLLSYTPEKLEKKFNIKVKTQQKVTNINRSQKKITIEDSKNNETKEESYDLLLLSPGASPIVPEIDFLERIPSFALRDIPDMDKIDLFFKEKKPTSCVIIGGGFIGIEMAENLAKKSIEVNLVSRSKQMMNLLDPDMSTFIEKEMIDQNVHLFLNDEVVSVDTDGRSLNLKSGKTIETDFILLAVGIKPNIQLAKDAQLKIGETGAIEVNEYMQTSDPSIYAVGDAVQVKDWIKQSPIHVPLAWAAHRQSYIAARHIVGQPLPFKGLLGTFIVKAFDLHVAKTGLNENDLKKLNIPYETVQNTSYSHAHYYPVAGSLTLKLLFCPQSGAIYGAQAIGRDGVDKRIDVIATAILGGLHVEDLEAIETAYAPPYSSPKDAVNIIGYKAAAKIRKA
jgi:CoA-disulfide reductase